MNIPQSLLCALLICQGVSHPLGAAPNEEPVLTVNATADDSDALPGDGICETAAGNGVCTLRAALQEAAASGLDGEVAFDLSPADPGYDGSRWTIALLSVLPDIDRSLSLAGPGAKLLTVTRAADATFRIFHVTSAGEVSFAGMTISNGYSSADNGGGILCDGGGTVNVTECSVEGNRALRGAGLSNQGSGTLNVVRCAILSNVANGGTGSRGGGGITNENQGTVNVTNSTIFGNAGFVGGGIRNASVGLVNVSNCTVAANVGRGFDNIVGTFRVKSTALSANITGNVSGDIKGPFTSLGFNFVTNTDEGSGFTEPTDQTGTSSAPLDAALAAPADNGGPTKTMQPAGGSRLIDRGSSVGLQGALTTDQRGTGFARTFDDPNVPNAVGGDGTDIGALEVDTSLILPARLANISTRLVVDAGEFQGIAGFINSGGNDATVLVRGIGPSLASVGVSGVLPNPTLELHDGNGAVIATNDNWRDTQETLIESTGLAPSNELESAFYETLGPGLYTAILGSADGATGVGLVEIYDVSAPAAELGNLSTRGLVLQADQVMIGGAIITGQAPATLLIRALGPSLPLNGALSNPSLVLVDAQGSTVASNDNWRDTQESKIVATGLAPPNEVEAAVLATLNPGNYTAIVRGEDGSTGVALLELYKIQ